VGEVVAAKLRIKIFALTCLAWVLVEGCSARQSLPPPSSTVTPIGTSVTGVASWYGPGFNGHRTSSGSIYNQDDMSAASTLFPLGTRLRVTNLTGDRSVEVLVNDHGPYVHGRDLDLSHRAALMLGIVKPGTARVRMDVLSTPAGGPPLGERYYVQVGSFSDVTNAQRVGDHLRRFYRDVHVVEASFGANRYYRVRMGMFVDRSSAEQRALSVYGIGLTPVIISE
jgi:rare lipoprotein A